MSYCRHGKDSDLYVWSGIGGYHCVTGDGICRIAKKEFITTDVRELLEHLFAHLERGDLVPKRAIARVTHELYDELKAKGKRLRVMR